MTRKELDKEIAAVLKGASDPNIGRQVLAQVTRLAKHMGGAEHAALVDKTYAKLDALPANAPGRRDHR